MKTRSFLLVMNLQFTFVAIASLYASSLLSQCLVPFSDFNNFVYVFDNAQSNYIENLPLRSFQVGRNVFAYTGQNNRLKVYYYGKVYPVVDNTPNYHVTDNWFLYQNFNTIRVLDKNEFKTLEVNFSEGVDSLYYSDSLIVWSNRLGELNVYYNGATNIIERTEITNAKIGDNTFAYIDRNGNFKVYYSGELTTLEVYQPLVFYCNRNIVLYVDQFGNYKYFYKGKLYETSINRVAECWTGENFFAYITILKQLVVMWEGEEVNLIDDRPKVLQIKENIIYWVDKGNNTWCFYKGKKYWLERYMPLSVQIDNDIIVYQDLDGRLKGFYYGEQLPISDQIVQKYDLYNEAVRYSLRPYETKVWCNKQTYTFN